MGQLPLAEEGNKLLVSQAAVPLTPEASVVIPPSRPFRLAKGGSADACDEVRIKLSLSGLVTPY